MKIIKKSLLIILSVFLIFFIYLLINTFAFTSKQKHYPPIKTLVISPSSIAHLSQAIQIKTISNDAAKDFDSLQFKEFSTFLETTYPIIESKLEKKIFNSFSVLYKWQGSDPSLKPIVLMGHLDVVPVNDVDRKYWKADPFAGEIKGDTIWGRGSLDDKFSVVGIMESVELLLKSGFHPKRTIYLAFGHDEEVGGINGATAIANYLKAQGVKAEFILDEGGNILQGILPGIQKDVALIGIAEKGIVSLQLSVNVQGGHSAIPERETAIDLLASAITKLKSKPLPAHISAPMEAFIDVLGPEMPFVNKLAFANRFFFTPLIINVYKKTAAGSALVNTTMTPTVFNAGIKENSVPSTATATINFRMLPGTTIASVTAYLKSTLNDDRIKISASKFHSEPSKVSSTNSFGYETIQKTILETHPEVLVAPYLVVGVTDSRHYSEVSNNIYRFSTIHLNKGNIKSLHGLNEKLAVTDFNNVIRFYVQLIKNSN